MTTSSPNSVISIPRSSHSRPGSSVDQQDREVTEREFALLAEGDRAAPDCRCSTRSGLTSSSPRTSFPCRSTCRSRWCSASYLEEHNIPCIAVHHDFYWQDPKLRSCSFEELLTSYFPASLPNMRHVTINQKSREELYRRTGVAATCIHNCFDFDSPRAAGRFQRRPAGGSGPE